jgi:hypothetical protein
VHRAERDHIRVCLERRLPLLNVAICQMSRGRGCDAMNVT